ncbi:MAG TPA: hypothetical protein VFE50_26665 [Cyclobacteriaceae bacterium]|nr:hypothetical protein [Cyclobacteriaceae bacterium]
MPIPKKIPIQRMEDYHTHYIGKIADGRQFFGYESFVFPSGVPANEWQSQRKEYVVLYIFDSDGNHLETLHWFAGTTAEQSQGATTQWLEKKISELGDFEYTDINVKPFQTIIDGVVFGLVPNEEYEVVELEPGSAIAFHEPWDGEYDT